MDRVEDIFLRRGQVRICFGTDLHGELVLVRQALLGLQLRHADAQRVVGGAQNVALLFHHGQLRREGPLLRRQTGVQVVDLCRIERSVDVSGMRRQGVAAGKRRTLVWSRARSASSKAILPSRPPLSDASMLRSATWPQRERGGGETTTVGQK